VGIIMDGNGRWAESIGRSRSRGHVQGARAARTVAEEASSFGIGVLTLYAFSADNWKRPAGEVRSLMRLLRVYLKSETERCRQNGVRIEVIGRRDRLPPTVVREMVAAEGRTSGCDRLLLRLAIDYSGRDAILAAAFAGAKSRREFQWNLDRAIHATTSAPELDLLIRTGGESRLSDFMLWESAYAELVFSDVPWPAFTPEQLGRAVEEFRKRDRRYGGLKPARPRPAPDPRSRPPTPRPGSGSLVLPGAAIPHSPRR